MTRAKVLSFIDAENFFEPEIEQFNEVMMGATFFTGGTGLGTGLVTQDLI